METKPYSLQAPEAIAKEYGGNKQKIAQAVQMGIVNPTAALLAGMFIDRMRNAAPAEQAPTQTVAEEVFNPQPAPSMPAQGLAAMRQPQMPQGMPPQGMPPQGMPPQGLAAMQQPQMPSMASGGAIGYAEGGFPDLYESRNKFDYEIEALKNQLRDTETDNRRGLAERLKQITMGDPAVLPELSDDPSLIEFGERNRDLRALKERALERSDEGLLSSGEYENLGLETLIPENEYMARSRISALEEEIAEREAERQAAVTAPDNFQITDDAFNALISEDSTGVNSQQINFDALADGRQEIQIDPEGNPITQNALIQPKGINRKSEDRLGGLQTIVDTPIDEPSELTGIEAATSDYEKLQEMLGKSKTDEDMTKEAV
jgi:hypothetical protein